MFQFKDSGLVEQILIAMLIICNVLGHVLALAIMFAITKYWGFVALAIILLCLQITAFIESNIYETKKSKSFLGVLTSFISPCLIIKDDSKHFLINGLVGSVLYTGMIWFLYFKASVFRNIFPDSPLMIQCFHNISSTVVMKCPLNATDNEDCFNNTFVKAGQQHFTICPQSYDQWYFLWMMCLIATAFLSFSMFSITYLHLLIDPVRRMMEGRRIGINIWPEKNVNIRPYVVQIMNGEDYGNVSNKAKDATGKGLLELGIQSGLLHFTKVLNDISMYFSLTYRFHFS